MKSVIICVICLIVFFSVIKAQNKKQFNISKQHFYEENFQLAIPLYRQLLESDPENSGLNYKLGFCYLHTYSEKEKSVLYFRKAVDNISSRRKKKDSNAPYTEAWFYLGRAYRLNYEFKQAFLAFRKVREKVLKDAEALSIVDHEIQICQEAMKLMENTINVAIKNTGIMVNSDAGELAPIWIPSLKALIFSSNRQGSAGILDDLGHYSFDIYITYRESNGWTTPVSLGNNINTDANEIACCISASGNELYLTIDSDIFVSRLENGQWQKPDKLKGDVNTDSDEAHASISSDGKVLYFTSNRPGGHGGTDIYSAERMDNGSWQNIKNMGKTINTPFDEKTPYFQSYTNTLFFSSNGHNTIGGFDFFSCIKNSDNIWNTATNLGYPLNTTDDELYYYPLSGNKTAFYSGIKKESIGSTDIFQVNFSPKDSTTQTTERRNYISDDFYYEENFKASIPLYNRLLSGKLNDPELNFKLGFAYLHTEDERENAIVFFNKAIENISRSSAQKDLLNRAYFYLGRAYHLTYQFDKAISTYNTLKKKVSGNDDFLHTLEREIEFSTNAKNLIKMPLNITVSNLGRKINSEYADHGPIITSDESMLLFSSRRKPKNNYTDISYGQYFQDVYVVYNKDGMWTRPVSISENINTIGNEAICSLSPNGLELYICKEGDIYLSKFDSTKQWTVPRKLPYPINSEARETHAVMSANSKYLYFTSDRGGGLGGLDIYVIEKLSETSWGPPRNLGEEVNTPYNEETPFVHPNGVKLFFSSQGHNSMGGYDIFTSTLRIDGTRTKANNIGYPLNSVDDDLFFVPSFDDKRAYFSSRRTDGFGQSDMYVVYFQDKYDRNFGAAKLDTDVDFMFNENFDSAIPLYKGLLEENPDDPELNYKLGFCYLNSSLEEEKSIQYIEKFIELYNTKLKSNTDRYEKSEITEKLQSARFFLAKAYHLNYEFEKAVKLYNELKSESPNDKKLTAIIDHEIATCQNGIKLTADPVNIHIVNLGDKINSRYSDICPIISLDESTLMFSSNREGTIGSENLHYGRFLEDIYISKKTGEEWSEPERFSDSLNTAGAEIACSMTADRQKLIMYKDGDIYQSTWQDTAWSIPERLDDRINSEANETHAAISPDGKYLYFTSDREGGSGGFDIYVSSWLSSKKWKKPKNIGRKINTPYDEETPYIHSNGTLYFSSKGHNSMGGFDVFSVKEDSGAWSNPVNAGYPINTTRDDIYYVPATVSNYAYYSAQRMGGFGQNDIYQLRPIPPEKITIGNTKLIYNASFYIGHYATRKEYQYLLKALSDLIQKNPELTIDISVYQDPDDSELDKKREDRLVNYFKAGGIDPTSVYTQLSLNDIYPNTVELTIYDKVSVLKAIEAKKAYLLAMKNMNAIDNDIIEEVRVDENMTTVDKQPENKEVDTKTTGITKETNDSGTVDETVVVKDNETVIPTDTENADDQETDTVVIRNILFELNQFETGEYNGVLNVLAVYLKENANAKIEVRGHSDPQGFPEYNTELAKKRADFVRGYLLNQGANPAQVISMGYGSKYTITVVTDANGQYIMDALKYNRRVEFVVLQQGKVKLEVKPVEVPEKYKPRSVVNNTENTNEKNTTQENTVRENDLTNNKGNYPYSILLASSKTKISLNSFNGLVGVKEHLGRDREYIYYFGEYQSLSDAEVFKKHLTGLGYKNICIFINDYLR